MANNHSRKLRLLNRQAENFKQLKESLPNFEVSPYIPNMVLCPICFKVITLDTQESNHATEEHAPSAKLGGKIIGLTCKNCNSTQGSSLDSKLIEYYKLSENLKGNSANFTRAKARLNDLRAINVEVKFSTDNSWRIIPLEDDSSPEAIAGINQAFSHPPTVPFTLNLQITHPHPRIIRIALVRAAYLIAFGQFGYGFVVNPALNYIRNLLVEPNNENLYPHGVMFNFPIGDEFLGVSIITEPMQMRSYLVVFDIFDGKKQIDRVGVILPGWSENPVALYNYIRSIDGRQIQLSTQKIENEIDFFKDFPLATLDHWELLFHRN